MHIDSRRYNKDTLFSYRATLMFSISERGLGKTFGAKSWCVDDFKKRGYRFVWIRRYAPELFGDRKTGVDGCLKTFCDDIRKYYPNDKLEIKGSHMYINGKDAGVFLALSTSQQVKSNAFSKVNKIIFDEFIIKENKSATYLKNEPELLLDLMSTVFRPMVDENGHEVLQRTWLLANSITFANDYFFYWNLKPFSGRFYHDKARGIVVEQCENQAYREAVRQTRFGKLIKGTKYEGFAIDNQYRLDNNDFIGKKSSEAQLMFNVRYDGHEWGIYADAYQVYVSWKVDPNQKFYVFTNSDHTLKSVLIKSYRATIFETLVRNYQLGLVICENIMIKKKFIDFMKLFIVK